jgi:predicted nucleotidyltransferase
MLKDNILERAFQDLVKFHQCHTVILYGSRSRGDFTEESDYDLMGFRDQGPQARDARLIDGKFLDAFIYPINEVVGHEKDFLRVRKGRILRERDGFGGNLLNAVEEIFKKGPPSLREDEGQMIRTWIRKMLIRIAKEDIEGNYRRAWLQFELLENYFKLRGRWYLGPKESFAWLAENEPEVYELFDRALRTDAAQGVLQDLAEKVLEVRE